MTSDQTKTVMLLAIAAAELVKAAGPLGVPADHIYATLMPTGSPEHFEALMRGLVRAGVVTRRGNVYHFGGVRAAGLTQYQI